MLRAGLCSESTDRGLRTSYVYDAASRLSRDNSTKMVPATMTYDASSQRTVLSDWTGLYTSTYDPDGRINSVVNPAGIAITYTYDAVGQRRPVDRSNRRDVHVRLRPRRTDQQLDQPRWAR